MQNLERPHNPSESSETEMRDEKEKRRTSIIALTKELSELQERLPFSGIEPENYLRLKADDATSEDHCTPIDELIQRFEKEGIRVAFGENLESGNVYVLPFQSNDIESDGIFPKHLRIDASMDSRLIELILASRS
jgi:hypothetical protein